MKIRLNCCWSNVMQRLI